MDNESNLAKIEEKVAALVKIVSDLIPKGTIVNKDGIPLGTEFMADIEASVEVAGKPLSESNDRHTVVIETLPRSYRLKQIDSVVIRDGRMFNSLSAAAEELSRIKRKSGWIFWRDRNGRTAKEAYKEGHVT